MKIGSGLPVVGNRSAPQVKSEPRQPEKARASEGAEQSRLLNTLLDDATYTVLDCEMTGLDPDRDALLEVAVRKFRHGRELKDQNFQSLVNPGQPIPPDVTELTGIRDKDVANAPSVQAILPILCRLVGPHPILVGDFVDLDIQFLRKKLEQVGLGRFKDRFNQANSFCTRTLARKVFPEVRSGSAGWLAFCMGWPKLPEHRADNDIRNAYTVFSRLVTQLREQRGLRTLAELCRFQGPILTMPKPEEGKDKD
ncbi:MAG TPA: 3'-5' exonuclease [Coleofasciculaceae cyanobacterium]|jgi:DNA polymerase III alpha subunit (gram-positive type)